MVGIGGLFTESGSLPDALGQILGQVANVAARFLSTTENALDVDLLTEAHHVGGLGQRFAGLLPARQRHPSGRSVKARARESHTGSRSSV